MEKRKNAANRFGGYYYQSQVAVLKFVSLLTEPENDNYVVLENPKTQSDIFDDITFQHNGDVHHYQVKWGMNLKNELRPGDFTGPSKPLYLKKLFESWKQYQKTNSKLNHIFHIYTSKKISSQLSSFLSDCSDDLINFVDNPNTSKSFSKKCRNYKNFDTILNEIITDNLGNETEITQFFDSLVIEYDKPQLPASSIEEQYENPMKNFILLKIENKLGINEKPFEKDLEQVYDILLQLCYDSALYGKRITKNHLYSKLKISDNLNAIPQNFIFNKKIFINPKTIFEKTINKIQNSSGKKLLLIGEPGSGKSWFLTNLFNFYKKSLTFSPLLYYCYINEEGQSANNRITANQLFQNLTHEIQTHYGKFLDDNSPKILSSSKNKLLHLLQKIGTKAVEQGEIIPIIIDGLDHVYRINQNLEYVPNQEQNIVQFLKTLKVPPGICLVIGTQPNKKVMPSTFEKIIFSGFNLSETAEFLKKFQITKKDFPINQVKKLYSKTNGLPLQISYMMLSHKRLSYDKRLLILKSSIKKCPATNGNIIKYYDWLWSEFKNKDYVIEFARVISLLEFPASHTLLRSVIPKGREFYHNNIDNVDNLSSLLQDNKIQFFHESFRRYVLEDKLFSKQEKYNHLKSILEFLTKNPIYKNELSFRYALFYAYKIKSFETILKIVDLDLIDNALIHFRAPSDIHRNIVVAIKAAVKKKEFVKTLYYSLLRKYTDDRIENISWEKFAETAINLGAKKELWNFIFSESRPTFSTLPIMEILATCIRNNLQFNSKILLDWFHENIDDSENPLDGISSDDYAVVLTHAYGLQSSLRWVILNQKKNKGFFYSVYDEIAKTCNISEVLKIKNSAVSTESIVIIAFALFYNKKYNDCKKFILDSLKNGVYHIFLLHIASRLKINKKIISKYFKLYKPTVLSYDSFSDHHDFSDLDILKSYTIVLAYCDQKNQLRSLKKTINGFPTSSTTDIQKLVIEFGKIEGKSLNNITIKPKSILSPLESFLSNVSSRWNQSSEIECRKFLPFTNNLIRSIIDFYFVNSKIKNLDNVSNIIDAFGHTSVYVLSLSPLDGYTQIAKYLENTQKISLYPQLQKKFVSDNESTTSTFLSLADFHHAFGNLKTAKEEFFNAIKFSFQHGYHKDTLLQELLDVASYLNSVSPNSSLDRYSDILQLTPLLDIVTDHDHTHHTLGMVIEEVMKQNPYAGIKLLSKVSHDSWTYYQGMASAVQYITESSIVLRFLLAESLPFESPKYNDQYWALDMRFSLIAEALKKKEYDIAKFMVYRTRSIFSEPLSASGNSQHKLFNKFAKLVNEPLVKLPPLEDWMKKKNPHNSIDFKSMSLDVEINKFKSQSFSKRIKTSELFMKYIKTQIAICSEKDLDKIFALRKLHATGGEFSPLVKLIVKRYKELHSKNLIKILIQAFEDGHGWSKNWGTPITWLVDAYNLDKDKATLLILQSFARYSIEKWGPHESLERLGLFFLKTKQNMLLQDIYETFYLFCKELFRFYEPFPTKYDELRTYPAYDGNYDDLIIQLFESYKYLPSPAQTNFKNIPYDKTILNYKDHSVSMILNEFTE